MIIPQPPFEPDYEKIIKEELKEFDEITIITSNAKDKKSIKIRNAISPYANPAYNEAVVEAFETNVQSKIKTEYFRYLRELEEYENHLKLYLEELSKEKTKHKQQIALLKIDFKTAKTFYENFQELTKSKFKFISELVKSVLNKNRNDAGDGADE